MYRRRGQSTLEYIIVLTAIVAGVIAAVTTFGKKDSSGGLGMLMNKTANKITTESERISNIIK